MANKTLTTAQALTLLAETPQRLATLSTGLEPEALQTPPTHEEWSANVVLAHLRANADVWGSYIASIIVEDHPTLRAISPRAWMQKTDYHTQDFVSSLRAFTTQRAELLATLKPLPPVAWARAATVKKAGSPMVEKTALDYARQLALHEQAHIQQVEGIVAALCP
jgi:hypothetical protein